MSRLIGDGSSDREGAPDVVGDRILANRRVDAHWQCDQESDDEGQDAKLEGDWQPGEYLLLYSCNVRHHRSRWAMAFYYPQDVTMEMGPTAILPASQYYDSAEQAHRRAELPLCGSSGTVTVVHYDLWHRAMANVSDRHRYMVKFLFTRMSEPRGGLLGSSGRRLRGGRGRPAGRPAAPDVGLDAGSGRRHRSCPRGPGGVGPSSGAGRRGGAVARRVRPGQPRRGSGAAPAGGAAAPG